METLIGMIGVMRGFASSKDLFTVREVLEKVKRDKNLRETFLDMIGISPDEYIQLLETDSMPESSMNHLLQGYVEDMSK